MHNHDEAAMHALCQMHECAPMSAPLALQLALLLFVILGYSTLTEPAPGSAAAASRGGASSSSFSAQVQSNMFSGSLVITALIVIAITVADRLAYLRRSPGLKLCVQVFTAVSVHVVVFLVVPFKTGGSVASNPLLAFFS